jgi:hypothetical protein
MSLLLARHLSAAIVLSLAAFTACHARAADAPRPTTPSMEVDVDDHGPDKSAHTAKLTIGFVNGEAKMTTSDSEAHYEVEAKTVRAPDSYIQLSLHRSHTDRSLDLEIRGSIAAQPNGRVVVARVDRADGRTTTVTALVR